MGGNNSVPQKISDEEILANINKLFEKQQEKNDITIQTLGMGECLECEPKKNRFAEFELQFGGELNKARNSVKSREFELFMNKFGGSRIDDEEFDETLDMDETIDFQDGGAPNDVTSDNFMSEIRKIGALSATSVDNIIPRTQNGGAMVDSVTSLSGAQPDYKQQYSATSNAMVGGDAQASDVTNVMPFYSSTSGTEYYNNMQKEHRYT